MRRQKRGARKRTGCTKCKESHVPCSEELPKCRRCVRLDLDCMRGLKLIFREDAVQRGISFGREGVWSKNGPPTLRNSTALANFHGISISQYNGRWVFLNLNEEDFKDRPSVFQERGPFSLFDNSILSVADSSIPRSIYHPFYSFPEPNRNLLDYFVQGIGPSCSLSSLYNPYISLVLPMCFASTTLQSAILAVAANQLCLLGNKQFTEDACHYKHMAMQGIREDLSLELCDEGTTASILMLCFHEISDACSLSWTLHLRAGLQMLEDSASRSSSDLWRFFRMYFVAHDIMSRTTSESDSWPVDGMSQIWHESDDLDEFDMLMGCSRGLLSLINRISIHASAKEKVLKARALTPFESKEYAKISSQITTALLSLKQELPAGCARRKDLECVAQIKHLAVFLYLAERLGHHELRCENQAGDCSAYPKAIIRKPGDSASLQITAYEQDFRQENSQEGEESTDEEAPSCDTPLNGGSDFESSRRIGVRLRCRNHLVSRMIELISNLPDLPTLLWPLFVLGNAGLQDEEQKRFVLDRLDSIRKTQNLGSVRRTIVAVKHAFKTKSLVSTGNVAWGHETYGYISLA